jgi:hypothetical protein
MTVACDEDAGAQAGVPHRDGRRAALTERRETRTVDSPSRLYDPCSSLLLTKYRLYAPKLATCTVSCKGRGRSAVLHD